MSSLRSIFLCQRTNPWIARSSEPESSLAAKRPEKQSTDAKILHSTDTGSDHSLRSVPSGHRPIIEMQPLNLSISEPYDAGSKYYCDTTILAILKRLLEPGADLTIEPAAALILDNMPVKDETGRQIPGTTAAGLFGTTISEISEQIPYTNSTAHARLAALMQRLSKATKLNFANAALSKNPGPHNINFADFRQELSVAFCHDGQTETEGRQWLNFSAFVARLTAVGFVPDIRFAIGAFMESLESPRADQRAEWVHRLLLCSAALWVILCGQTIFSQLVEDTPDTLLGRNAMQPLEDGKYTGEAFSISRWSFWKNALEAVGERQSGEAQSTEKEEWRTLVQKAVDLMGAIERSRDL